MSRPGTGKPSGGGETSKSDARAGRPRSSLSRSLAASRLGELASPLGALGKIDCIVTPIGAAWYPRPDGPDGGWEEVICGSGYAVVGTSRSIPGGQAQGTIRWPAVDVVRRACST
jgi:hypothetical protein